MTTPADPTYGRRTRLRVDIPEPVVIENPFATQRQGKEINANRGSEHVALEESGAWTIQSVNDDLHRLREQGDPDGAIFRASVMQLAPALQETLRYRPPDDLPGVRTGGNPNLVAGDPFLLKRVAANRRWDDSAYMTLPGNAAALPPPPISPAPNIALDRVAATAITMPENFGFQLRWEGPGTRVDQPDVILVVYFGGPTTYAALGRYSLVLYGNGTAQLWEDARESLSAPVSWVERAKWRYCLPQFIGRGSHILTVYTHWGRNQLIRFRSSVSFQAETGGGLADVTGRTNITPGNATPAAFIYYPPKNRFRGIPGPSTPPVLKPNQVTGRGKVEIDLRRDLRIPFQLSALRYYTTALLIDSDFAVLLLAFPRVPIALIWDATLPPGTAVQGFLFDPETGAELTPASIPNASGPNWKYYNLIPGKAKYQARFVLTSDGSATPCIWGYRIRKDGVMTENSPGTEFETPINSLSLSGAERDITQENASVTVEDPTGQLSLLNIRGQLPCQLETDYIDHSGNAGTSVLIRGYIVKPTNIRKGRNTGAGMTGAGIPTYPTPAWRRFTLPIMGMWMRLQQSLSFMRLPLYGDPNATPAEDGSIIPYKVTDIIRAAIQWAGFPDDMIDVPDNPFRFFQTGHDDAAALVIQPFQSLWEWVTRLATEYLGHHILFDANAGTRGMWRLRPPATPNSAGDYNNLFTFVLGPESDYAGGIGIPSVSQWAYREKTTFIRRGTMKPYTRNPEANAVIVLGIAGSETQERNGRSLMQGWAVNKDAINFFTDNSGNPIQTADPLNEDYLPYLAPVIIADPTLQTRNAVMFMVRRLFQMTCHAVKGMTFEAPLVLATDPTDSYLTKPRPLRFYDPVTIRANGVTTQWFIRSVNPTCQKDNIQFASYEVEAPKLTLPGEVSFAFR